MNKPMENMAFAIVLMGCLGGTAVVAEDKPTKGSQEVMITSPKNGDKVNDSFELKYQIAKTEQVGHVHVFVDDEYQRGFHGMIRALNRGQHTITVKTTSMDHSSVTASHTITIDVR